MRRQGIPGTTVCLTELGFGGAVIGNLYRASTEDEAAAAVDAAWDAGIGYFDTAPHYGLGLSERRLGQALRHRPRDEYVVSSKVGRLLVPNEHPTGRDADIFAVPDDLRRQRDYLRDGVRRSLADTLERMGLDRIDVVYVHDPDEHWTQAADEAMPALAELRDAGVVGAIGAGMNSTTLLTRFLRETAADLVMVAGRYTLLDQSALDDVLPAATETGKGVVAVGVFNSGLLAQPWPVPGATYDYAPASAELLDRARRIADVCSRHGTTLPAAAVAFPLAHPNVVNVTLGMRTAAEVAENLALHADPPPAALWTDLQAAGLLRPDAPIP
ncbi:aldo/keto reductase [uncultured Friedmanniella sp.]|uniref:aldo/keto reductase n=1 Tax=uncultured Friedmanniella sp. TaxID=335381 RepID=UPI0035CB9DF3